MQEHADGLQLADAARAHRAHGLEDGRIHRALLAADEHLRVERGRGVGQQASLSQRAAERFFDIHGDAAPDAGERGRHVPVVWRGNTHGVDAALLQHVAKIGVDGVVRELGDASALGAGLGFRVDHADTLDVAKIFEEIGQVAAALSAGAEQAGGLEELLARWARGLGGGGHEDFFEGDFSDGKVGRRRVAGGILGKRTREMAREFKAELR